MMAHIIIYHIIINNQSQKGRQLYNNTRYNITHKKHTHMQANKRQSISSCLSCGLSCLSQQKHKGDHYKVQLSILRFLMQQKINNFDDSLIKGLVMNLKAFVKIVENCISEVENLRLQVGLGLREHYVKSVKAILDNDQRSLGDVTCSQVYAIQSAVSQDKSKESTAIFKEKYEQISNKLSTQFLKFIKQPKLITGNSSQKQQSLQPQKSQPQAPLSNSKPNPPNQSSLKKSQHPTQFSQLEQPRPIRSPIQKQNTQQHNKDKPNKHNDPYMKIVELEKVVPKQQYFVTAVKVLKILNKCQIKGSEKYRFLGGDDTGKAICTFQVHPLIKAGNTIRVTDCWVFIYQGRERQIQNGKNSVITMLPQFKTIGEDYDLSALNRNTQKVRNNRRIDKQDGQRDANRYDRDRDARRHDDRDNERRPRRQQPREQVQRFQYSSIRESRRQQPQRRNQQRTQLKTQNAAHNSPQRTQSQPQKSLPNYTKIKDINPGEQGLNIISKIHQILEVQQTKLICHLGDETGVVKAQLPATLKIIQENNTIKLLNVEADVVNGRIVIKIQQKSKIETIAVVFPIVKITNNISEVEWESDGEDN